MAANIVTALAQVAQEVIPSIKGEMVDRVNWDSLQAALNLSSWTEDLQLDDWYELQQAVKSRSPWELYDWLEGVAVEYLKTWAEFGFPANREAWVEAKHQKHLKEKGDD